MSGVNLFPMRTVVFTVLFSSEETNEGACCVLKAVFRNVLSFVSKNHTTKTMWTNAHADNNLPSNFAVNPEGTVVLS